MEKTDIALLRDEANRLVKQEISLLRAIQRSPNLLTSSTEQAQTLDLSSLPKTVEQLEGEQKKLENLELVLAVVGTMKAGKSTTINAIVGMEILPNRNRPMTALPTLIRHTLGVKQPRLLFANAQPVNKLIKQLKPALAKASPEHLQELNSNDDMQELIQRIEQQQDFVTEHIGSEAIFEFLKGLNDLVRLSTELEVEFPFAAYSQIDLLPVIEVEFTHLSEMDNVSGRLALLDTPGPNEAGQKHLRPMMQDQLKKASAVLAVLDYTQLKSDADNEIRKNLEAIAGVTGERLYTLVNKFDQKDRNSDGAEAVKKYVAESLMKGIITEDRVFPVSSRLGYLAGQAKSELAINGKLPCHKAQPWVEDFAEEGFGRRWESKIDNAEQVQEAIEDLWIDSLFAQPLEQVVQQAYSNAAIFAVDSAAKKMLGFAEDIKNFLGVREQAFKKNAEDLKAQVASLQMNLKKMAEHEQSVSNEVDNSIQLLAAAVKQISTDVQNKTSKALDDYFEDGKKLELPASSSKKKIGKRKKNAENAEEDSKVAGNSATWGLLNFFGINRDSSETQGFTPGEIMEFKSRKDAEDILQEIKIRLREATEASSTELQAVIDNELNDFEIKFNSYVDLTKNLLESLQDSMSDFDIKIRLPRTEKIYMDDFIQDVLGEATEETTKTERRRRRASGLWGTLCSLFDTDDWGYEEYTTEVDVYLINIPLLKKNTLTALRISFENVSDSIENDIRDKLNQQKQEFFTVLNEKLQHIQGDLLASIADKERTQEEQAALLLEITELYREVPGLVQDTEALNHDIQQHLEGAA